MIQKQKKIIKYGIFGVFLILLLLPFIQSTNSFGTQAQIMTDLNYNSNPDLEKVVPSSASTSYSKITIEELNRTYSIGIYGIITIEDTFVFFNNQSSTVNVIDICIRDEDIDKLVYYNAYDANSGKMAVNLIPEKLDGNTVIEIILNNPLLPYSTKKISTKIALKNMLVQNYYYSQSSVETQLIPITPYNIDSFSSKIVVPSGSTEVDVSSQSYIVGEIDDGTKGFQDFYGLNINAFTLLLNTFTYKNLKYGEMTLTSVNRKIIVNPWGYIHVVEEHHLHSMNQNTIYEITLMVPKLAENVNVSDDLGEIRGTEVSEEINSDGKTKNAKLRFYANRAQILPGSTTYYVIEYDLPYDEYISKEFNTHNFKIDIFTTKSEFLIEEQITQVILLSASTIMRMNVNPELEKDESNAIIFRDVASDITKYHINSFDITYKISFFKQIGRGLIFSLICLAVLTLYVVSKNVFKDNKDEKEKYIEESIPIQELTQFINLAEEKNAILIDIEKADRDLLRRSIKKKAYGKTVSILTKKLKGINEELLPFKKDLLKSTVDLKHIVQKLDYLEAEKMSVKDSIKLLNSRYRKGKLPSKAAFDKLSREMLKRLSSAQKKMDRYINELRAFII